MECPLCSSDNISLFSRDKKRDYLKCMDCGFVFVPPKFHLSPEKEKARYDLHQNNPDNKGYRNFLLKLLTPVTQRVKTGARGLDFGSGPEPVLAEMFKERGYSMNLYDIFYAPIPENLEICYDFITLSEVAEHLGEPGKIIKKLLSTLNPGGILAIMTQPVVEESRFGQWHYKNDVTHIGFFSEKSFRIAAETNNCTFEPWGRDVFILKKKEENQMIKPAGIQEISFISDGLELKGVLHLPERENPPVVIGSHGLLSTKSSSKQVWLAEKCCEYGIAYFRIDHTGCGESQGELVRTTLDTRVGDLVAAAQTLFLSGFQESPMALFGSSMGGATCIKAWKTLLKKGFSMKCLVTLAAPVKGKSITETALKAEDELSGIPFSFYQRNMGFDLTENIKTLYNVLIFHGDEDEIVPFSNAETILNLANTERQLIVNKGGDHRMTDPEHQKQFLIRASQWFNTFLNLN